MFCRILDKFTPKGEDDPDNQRPDEWSSAVFSLSFYRLNQVKNLWNPTSIYYVFAWFVMVLRHKDNYLI